MSKLIGQTFSRLTIIEDLGWRGKRKKAKQVRCRCECGKITTPWLTSLRIGRTKSCGCWKREIVSRVCSQKIGEKHHNWKGGRIVVSGGYIRVKVNEHHRADCNGYVMEHIIVMERKIGRGLLPGETVHHINGIRHDNRTENLELWDTNHCAGQRHVEKIAFHTSEILTKSSDHELSIVLSSILKRMLERGILIPFAPHE